MKTPYKNSYKKGLATEIVLIIIALVLLAGVITYLNRSQTASVSPTASSTGTLATSSSSDTSSSDQSANVFLAPARDFIAKQNPTDANYFSDPHISLDTIRQIPTNAVFLLEIPFHRSNKSLYIYVSADGWSDPHNNLDSSTRYYLVVKDKDSGEIQYASSVNPISTGANSGAIFLPIALTPDDQNIIARAFMSSPGAGGGGTDYGYTRIPVSVPSSAEYELQDYYALATPESVFYDSYGSVVYLDAGTNTPTFPQPGPRSTSEVVYKDLVGGTQKTLLATKDTMYTIDHFDAQTDTLTLIANTYTFSASCPRGKELQGCEAVASSTVSIVVPK